MEIVSFLRSNPHLLNDRIVSRAAWECYWRGDEEVLVDAAPSEGGGKLPIPGVSPLWEYLIDGRLELAE